MANLLIKLRKILARVSKRVHKLFGFRVDYTLIIDHTVNPKTTITFLNMPILATALVKQVEREGGRLRETPAGGGLFTQEQQPFFQVSRDSLKADGVIQDSTGATPARGTRFVPQFEDKFIETGTTSPKFTVKGLIVEGTPKPGLWVVAYEELFRQAAAGTSSR